MIPKARKLRLVCIVYETISSSEGLRIISVLLASDFEPFEPVGPRGVCQCPSSAFPFAMHFANQGQTLTQLLKYVHNLVAVRLLADHNWLDAQGSVWPTCL